MYQLSCGIAVIGGGASGLCAAITAARAGGTKKTVIFEALPRVGKKLLATGNGRCNLTNTDISGGYYNGDSAFAMEAIRGAGENAAGDFFASLGLRLKAHESGRVYPLSNQAASVLDALRFEAANLGVEIITDCKITSIIKTENGFILNEKYFAEKLIIAAGGRSAEKLGSDGSGFKLLSSLGVCIIPPFPALTGLILDKTYPRSLKGVRAWCKVSILNGERVLNEDEGEVQFNENGVSGIPVMQISRSATELLCVGKGMSLYVEIDCLPSMEADKIKEYVENRIISNGRLEAENLLTGLMPKALGRALVREAEIPFNTAISEISGEQIKGLCRAVKSRKYIIQNVAGYEASQVTAGGADTKEFSPETLESYKIKGLYCCGEVLNVDGQCGGYNLHWAWCSGIVAGESAGKERWVV